MYTQIGTTNKFNSNNSYKLIYTNDQYYLHTVDIDTNAATEEQLNNLDVQPKFISLPAIYQNYMWWYIIDVYGKIHILTIESNGNVTLDSKLNDTYDNIKVIFIEPITDNRNGYTLYYLDEDNTVKTQEYCCDMINVNNHLRITFTSCKSVSANLPSTVKESDIEYIGIELYINIEDKLYTIYDDNTLNEIDDYSYQPLEVTFYRNNNIYTYNKCLSILYKNGNIVHKFDKPYNIVSMTHRSNVFSQFVIHFASANEVTYIIDNQDIMTIHKFHIDNIQFMDNMNILSMVEYKSKIKTQMITFMMANKLVNNKIPKMLVYKIVCFIE